MQVVRPYFCLSPKRGRRRKLLLLGCTGE